MSISEFQLAQSYLACLRAGTSDRKDIPNHESAFGRSDGMVYFVVIGAPYITHVKIGFTRNNPFARMAELQTGCPFEMRVFGYVLGNQGMERELHDVLADDRACGEWFAYSDYVSSTIDRFLDAEVCAA